MKISVHWYVEDGFVGSSRPRILMFDSAELDDCETEEEFGERIGQLVGDTFRERVCPAWDDEALPDIMAKVLAERSK